LSKNIVEKVRESFRPQAPLWACELTSRYVVVTGVNRKRSKVEGKSAVELPEGSLSGSLSEKNIIAPDSLRDYMRQALTKAGFKGVEIGVVVPDDTARISLIVSEKLPSDPLEHQTFIRWKLKKTVPFDVENAQVAFRVLGPHLGNGAKVSSHDLLVVLSPRAVIREYEELLESLELDAGFVLPSTLAALNLFDVTLRPAPDTLFLKIAPDCVTTTIFQNGRVEFYRRVSGEELYDAVFPTVLYYQDKLGGKALERIVFCSYDETSSDAVRDLQHKLGVPAHRLGPAHVDDIYKPALGAVHFSWANLT
jgi:type IV pilus assembly protein PilM